MANKYASYTVRLNWKTDLDLIAMFKHPDFNFAKFMRMAIVAFVRGDDDFYIIPPERKCDVGYLDNVEVHFRLNYETESDVIAFLTTVKKGQGCTFFKLVFRSYLKSFYFAPFLSDQYAAPTHGFYKKTSKGNVLPNRLQAIIYKKDNTNAQVTHENNIPETAQVDAEITDKGGQKEKEFFGTTSDSPIESASNIVMNQTNESTPILAEAAEQIPNAFQPDENSENNESNEENNEDSSALFDMFGSMMDL